MIDVFAVSNGLLLESDTVSLSKGLKFEHLALRDEVNGARHTLNKRAWHLVQQIKSPIKANEWLSVAHALSLKRSDVSEIILFLNSIGGLKIKRQLRHSLVAKLERISMLVHGLRPTVSTRRWPADISGLLRGTSRAFRPLALLCLLNCLLFFGAGITWTDALVYPLLSLAIFYASAIVHEYVHVLFIDAHRPGAIIQRGLRFGVLHVRLEPIRDISSAVLGPIVGGLLAVLLCVLASRIFGLKYFTGIGVVMLVAHLWSWWPKYGDGSTLIRHIRRRIKWQHTKPSYE